MDDRDEPDRLLEAAFIEGFRAASDKQAFLALAGVPLELSQPAGLPLKLVDVIISDVFTVGTASFGFASRELVYQPLPGPLVADATRLSFVYVSADQRLELSLVQAFAGHGSDHAGP
jgi:hypothetical protein